MGNYTFWAHSISVVLIILECTYLRLIGVLQYPIHPHHDVIGEAGPDPTYEAPPEYFQTMQM